MKLKASVGRAPASASLADSVYSLSLTAETTGEKQYLAGLLKAIRPSFNSIKLSDKPPKIAISVRYKKA